VNQEEIINEIQKRKMAMEVKRKKELERKTR
jgi:hypothetical protein